MNDKEIIDSAKICIDFLIKKEYIGNKFTGEIISKINCRNGGISDVKISPTLVFRGADDIK